MTDQTESASENAELLADLDFYDEDHWRNVMRQYPGAQDAIRKAAAAIRALEAKVREEHGKAVRVQATVDYLFPSYEEANRRLAAEVTRLAADRDRLAGEVERLQGGVEFWRGSHGKLQALRDADLLASQAEVARLTSELAETQSRLRNAISDSAHFYDELAAARENEARAEFVSDLRVYVQTDLVLEEWRVYRMSGPINDMRRDLIGEGDTWSAAIDAARSAGGEG